MAHSSQQSDMAGMYVRTPNCVTVLHIVRTLLVAVRGGKDGTGWPSNLYDEPAVTNHTDKLGTKAPSPQQTRPHTVTETTNQPPSKYNISLRFGVKLMDADSNRHNMSHVEDDFEESSVEDEPSYQFQYTEGDVDGDGMDDPHSQKRSIKKWTPEEVSALTSFNVLRLFPALFPSRCLTVLIFCRMNSCSNLWRSMGHDIGL